MTSSFVVRLGSIATFCFCFVTQPLYGASLTGIIRDFEGVLLDEKPVQVTNEATEKYWRTFSAEDGSYVFDDLPAGRYTLSVNSLGFTLSSFEEQGIDVGESGTTLDPVLGIGPGLGILGEKGLFDIMRVKPGEMPDLPIPRLGDHSDLSGFWMMLPNPFPELPNPRPEAAKLWAERVANGFAGAPGMRCLPQRPNGILGFGRFVQTTDRLVFLMEMAPGWRQIYLDGRSHPEDPNPTWQGHSIGHWEGDTLTVETIGFNGRGWNAGFPISEKLRMTETFQRMSYGEVAYTVTYDDPDVFETPWTQRATLELAPKQDVMETVCENNRW